MAYQYVRYEITDGVARIALARPEVLNSINTQMARELQGALVAAAEDGNARAVLLTGTGRGFCAGQDLAEVAPGGPRSTPKELAAIVAENYNPIIRAIRSLEKPVICAVNGVAAGAGANLALACDIVIAADTASFVQSFSRVGLIPDSGGTFFLPRLIGLARTTALAFLAEPVRAPQAAAMGMIYRSVEAASLEQEAMSLARRLAALPTRGLALTKRALERSMTNDLDAQLELEVELQGDAGASSDYAEGVRAFLEKREPRFTGR